MLLRRRPGRPTNDRLHEAAVIPAPLPLQGELGVDVSPDEHLAGVAAQAAEVDKVIAINYINLIKLLQ